MTRSQEHAQALVEAIVAAPVCLLAALLLVDGGIVVRDRIAIAQAATRAAEAVAAGRDPQRAATDALPRTMRGSAHVTVRDGRVVVRALTQPRSTAFAGMDIRQQSTVEVSS